MRASLIVALAFGIGCGSGGDDGTAPSSKNPEGADAGSVNYYGRATPFVAQPPAAFDARQRFLFALADVDGNGTRDDLMFDRVSGAVSVRLFGAFPKDHPYAGVDQSACTASAWANVNSYDPAKAQPNLDYCNAVVRPEETWATVSLGDPVHDAVRLLTGRFSDAKHTAFLLWDEGSVWLSAATTHPDARNARPGITSAYAFDLLHVDLSRIDVCAVPGLPATEVGTCAGDRWKNLARPWEGVAVGDIDGDGRDDVAGFVSIDDGASDAKVGVWALLMDGVGQSPPRPKLIAVVDAKMRGSPLRIRGGDVVAIDAGGESIVALGSGKVLADLHAIPGEGPLTIDEVDSNDTFLGFRAKRKSASASSYWILRDTLATWHCPWTPSSLDGPEATNACVGDNPLAQTGTHTVVLAPSMCPSDCRDLIQSKLDDPSVRNVVLSAGDYPVNDIVTVSSLAADGSHQAVTKRLLGQGGARLLGRNRYYALSADKATVTDVAPADVAAEVARFDKCRAYRDYDATGSYGSSLPAAVATSWYRYLRPECPVIQTLGSNVTVSGVTIDMSELASITAALAAQRVAVPQFVAIDVGYYANGWAWPYDQAGSRNTGALYHIIDTSQPPDENIRISRVVLDTISAAGVQTEPAPMPVRDLVVEDIRCTRSSSLANQGNCIEVDAPPMVTWPYDDAERPAAVPFSPPQTTNITIRKGPDDDSYCELAGSSQVVRISGAIGFVLDGCLVRKGLADGVFLYVTDTGAKLDATLRNDIIYFDPNVSPWFAYDTTAPARDNDALVTVSGRPMSRNSAFNHRLDVPASDPQLTKNRARDEAELYYLSKYLHRATPSQVLLDNVTSQVAAGSASDSAHRVHIKEELGLTGKLIVKDSRFLGGGRILSADTEDTWANTISCPNERVTNWSTATPAQKDCDGAVYIRSLVAGRMELFGYSADGTPLMLPDPFAELGTVHGSWFEVINGTATGIAEPDAIRILPGRPTEAFPVVTSSAMDGAALNVSTMHWPMADPPVALPTLP
jgi:hypothetical protein